MPARPCQQLNSAGANTFAGFTAVDFEEAVHGFYQQKNDEVESDEDKIIVDEKLIESAFDRLSEHEDVEIQDDDPEDSDQQDGQPAALQSKLAGKRIYTSEERLWQTVAGHESDLVRVPGMEFELLVVIAQHGPEGCLQSSVTHITGQDKHSVPARTDKLARKGYITKASVTAKHIRTSLLRLAKWAPSEPAAILEGGMLSYDALFDKTIALLKENGDIISIDDLYNGLDPKGKSNRKILLRSCQRLSQVGCTRLLRCRVQDEDGNPIMLAHGKGEKTVNAIQLLREPTLDDRSIWVNFRNRLGVNHGGKKKKKKKRATRDRDSGEQEEVEVDDEEEEESSAGDEDAEGETDDEAMFPQASETRPRGDTSEMPATGTASTLTPSRKSGRARKKSSLAQSADYARMFEHEEENSDQDAEFEITESASPENMRRAAPNTSTRTPPPRKKLGRPKKVPEKDSSVRPQNDGTGLLPEMGREGTGISVFEATPTGALVDVGGVDPNAEPPTSSKRQRKKSTKALEADALRAAGEPLLTEPVDGYDLDQESEADSVDSNDMENDEPDVNASAGTPGARNTNGKPKRSRGSYKRRDQTKADGKKREPIVKKREIPPEEYEEYDKFAQATAERQVRAEMKSGTKRTASMAQLDGLMEGPNKAPRIEGQDAAEVVVEGVEPSIEELPADRVAEIKASILARDEPGVYINPPGARNTKLENYVQRGRPRNAIIAVVKSEGLRSLPWFKHEGGPRFAPKASRRRTARIGKELAKLGEDKSPFFVEGSGSDVDGEVRTKKKRKLGEGQGKFRFEKRDNMPTPQAGEPGTFGMLGFGLDGAADEVVFQDDSEFQDDAPEESNLLRRTSRVSRRPSTGFDLAPIEDDRSPSPQAVLGAAEESSAAPPEDPIAAANVELAALQHKIGRPRKQDVIRIKILERQIELDAAARLGEAEGSADAGVSATGGAEATGNSEQDHASTATPGTAGVDKNAQGSAADEISALGRGDTVGQTEVPIADATAERIAAQPDVSVGQPLIEQPDATLTETARPEDVDKQPRTAVADQAPAPKSTAGPLEQPTTPISPAQAELDTLLALKPKQRTPEKLQRIDHLKSQIDDAYINSPGTKEELETLQKKRGKRSVVVSRRVAVLKDQFPEVGKPARKKRVSLPAVSGNVEIMEQDGDMVRQSQGGAAVGQSSSTAVNADEGDVTAPGAPLTDEPSAASVEIPHGLPPTQASEITGMKDGKVQTHDTTVSSVEVLPVSSTTPLSANEPPVHEATNQEASQSKLPSPIQAGNSNITAAKEQPAAALQPSRQPSVASTTPKTYPELVSGKRSHYPELFTKQYVTEHPKEKFHYRGGGKYARGERFSRAYVEKHPNEKFYRVENQGNVIRFARGHGPGEEESGGAASSPAIDPRIFQSDMAQRTSFPRDNQQAVTKVSAGRQQGGIIPSEMPDSTHGLPNQTQQATEPEASSSSVPREITSTQAEQSQQSTVAATPATVAAVQRAVSVSTEQTPLTLEASGTTPTEEDHVTADSAQSGSKRKRAKTQTKPDKPQRNARWREKRAIDVEPRFDRAYVEAHPDEHFYHRGKGWFSRGEKVSKEYVDAHPEETFKTVAKRYIRLPDPESDRETTPEEEPSEPINQELESTKSFNGVYTTYSREYVDNHPNETFFHRGGGKWVPGMPPPGSAPRTGVRGPGAEKWRVIAAKMSKDTLAARAAAREATTSATPEAPVPAAPAAFSVEAPAPTVVATPLSSVLTIYKPYSPKTAEKAALPSDQVVATNDDQPTQLVAEVESAATVGQNDDVEMTGHVSEEEDEEDAHRGSSPSPDMDGNADYEDDIIMDEDENEDEDYDDQYEPPMQEDDLADDVYDPLDEPEDEDPRPARTPVNPETTTSVGRVFFPVDLDTAVVIRRTEKQKPPAKPPVKRRARLQTVSKIEDDDDDVVDITDAGGATTGAAPQVDKPTRVPARGSKISRDMRLKAQGAWPYGMSPPLAMPASMLSLLMHPAQEFHPPTGTYGTFASATDIVPPPEQEGRRSLRPRTSLAKLPQVLEDDYIETPGLIVKLKIKNLASVLPPDTAFESGLFATNAASDAVPISKITGKPRRPYNKRSKRVTFQLDDSEGDEFRDDGEVEDEDMDEDSDELEVSDEEEGTAVARPERRKRSTGVNGELRIRDMASGRAFKDADRLVIAFALVAAICGGLRVEGINWTLIAHALGFRYDGGFLRRRWDHFKRTRKGDVDKLREAIHEPFLAAYQDDDFPRVDFQNLNNTDWPALFDWVQVAVVPYVQLQDETEGPQVPDLPPSREEVDEQFEIKEPANLYEIRLDEYFVTGTEQNRRALITKYTYGSALPGELRPKDDLVQDMALLRSWVRAVAVTKQYNYHPEAAAEKLRKFSPEMLQQVTAEMIENRTFSQERKSRMLPGRNYHISNECLQSFRRWPPRPDECRFLRFVAQAWKNINTHFQHNDQLSLVPSASDPEYLVLTNMSAQGMIRISTIYPEVKEDYDAPFPKLSPWGYCGPTYETKKVDMSRLKFPIVYTKTAAYKDDHALLNHVPIPLYPHQLEGELGVRIPFWVDIHGNLIDDVWDMVLRSILHLLVFRSGTTANMIEQAHGRKLWAWEVELALEWMREVGIAERVGKGHVRADGGWSGGWKAAEWWYCAFSPEVARWKAPVVVE